ncbi:hypothetical protein ABTK89_19525, partial [Acinetobacter baumannii]
DGLIRDRPANPWFLEVKADLLIRSGRKAEAIQPLRHALRLVPDATLIQAELADCLQSLGDPVSMNESVDLLRRSLVDDQNGHAYRLL